MVKLYRSLAFVSPFPQPVPTLGSVVKFRPPPPSPPPLPMHRGSSRRSEQNLVRVLRRRKVDSCAERKFITSGVSNISARIERSYEIFDYEQYII